jgi:hypothetical protein
LGRQDSNLSRDTLLDSLRMTYGYDGGPLLLEELEQYFDTPEHAAFAIQLAQVRQYRAESIEFEGRTKMKYFVFSVRICETRCSVDLPS